MFYDRGKEELIRYSPGKEDLSEFTVPSTVTSLGQCALECTKMTEINIPDSVKTIGKNAFYSCTRLTNISLPDSIKSIGERSFYNCSSLKEITIPTSVESIGKEAFYDSIGLREIHIPSSVKKIEDNAFLNCENVIIYGEINSDAEQYAKDNDIPFVGE